MNAPSVRLADLSTAQRMGLMRRAQEELKRNPKNIDAMLTIAGLASLEGNGEDSVVWLQKALSLRKKDAEILRRLVSACKDVKLLKQSRIYARKLCEVEPRNAENHRLHGRLLEESGMPQQAITALERAERLDPGDPDTLCAIGRCQNNLGDHEAARKSYAEALKVDPTHAMSLYGIAATRKFSSEEAGNFAEAAVKSQAGESDIIMKSMLLFAAGKVMDDCQRYDEAFDFYMQANKLRIPETREDFMAPFRNNIEAFTREFLASREGFGLATDRPIFIVGMPRSGTTLTESICAAHSKVTAADELDLLPSVGKSLGRDSTVPGAYRRAVADLGPNDVRHGAEGYLERAAIAAGNTPHFTDKMPHNFFNIGIIQLFFPNAKIIHVRRHPMDNCLSLFSNSMRRFHNAYKTDLTTLGLYYRQYLRLMQHWREVLPGKIHEVFYEDVVANTELNARTMLDYLGLDWEDGVMDRSRSQRSVRTLSGWQVRQPVYQTSKGRWHSYEKHLGPLIGALGPSIAEYEEELKSLSAMETESS